MPADPFNPSPGHFKSCEKKLIWMFGGLAAIHVFIFSAAFPFFNNVDEQSHFDLVVKYSQGHVPRMALAPPSDESTPYVVIFNTLEFLWPSNSFPTAEFPPPWTQPMEKTGPMLASREAAWSHTLNHECSQPPLYYVIAGGWWDLGKVGGLHDGVLLYWLRFLNIIFIVLLVWLGYWASRLVFPENLFCRLGVPALLVFMPQSAFYSIENDVLSPICFGAAFICLIKFLRAERPGLHLGTATGLLLAATFLVKNSNLPLLAAAVTAIFLKIIGMAKSGQAGAARPALLSLFFCFLLPTACWTAWCKYNFGGLTGMEAQARFMGMTLKPFSEWWQHPIFTPQGFWIFIHDLVSTFWQGEIWWHHQPLSWFLVDGIYVILTCVLTGMALLNLLAKSKAMPRPQHEALWLGFACLMAAIAFLGLLSIIYDFHDDFNPSRAHPYFSLGRLMLGTLIPFLLLFVSGFDQALGKISEAGKFLALAALILFMLISELITDWPVFSSQYNWFHM
jgi:Predicted membrane protein (DUF2142)